MKIAFGCQFNLPSFYWLGFIPSLELAKTFDVTVFDNLNEIPDADILVVIKGRLTEAWAARARAAGKKLVYFPVDDFNSAAEIEAGADWLRLCDAIVIHCERLRPMFAPYCKMIEFMEQPVLSTPLPVSNSREIVWSGHMDNLLPVLKHVFDNWYELRCFKIRLMTNLNQNHFIEKLLADCDGFDLNFCLRNVELLDWSFLAERELFKRAIAAFDVKGDSFNARHKPPIKALTYLNYGAPIWVNESSYSCEYLLANGLAVETHISERVLSHEYLRECRQFQRFISEKCSASAVGRKYKNLFQNLS